MSHQEKHEAENGSGESRLDGHIRKTRLELNLDTLYAPFANKEVTQRYFTNEFGFNSPQSHVVRRYLWLCVKLIILYMAKWFNWIFRRK